MPFATTSDNYLSVVSSFLVFVELSFVQAIRAGMMSENNWNPTLVGLVLFLLNVLWSLGLGFDMWWNLFGDSVKARVCGIVAGETDGADDGAEERGVETVEEARELLAQHVATIADMGCRHGVYGLCFTDQWKATIGLAFPRQPCVATHRPRRPR